MAGLTWKEQVAGFPVRQMVVVSLIRFSEPLAFTSLFPYLYFMIRDFQIAPTEKEISKYSGYLASSFAFCQFLFAMQWGRMLNRVGRKPVLLCGLAGTSVSLLLFGFSTNYWMALFARSLAGTLNGNIAVLRTVIGEICVERRHQALGFSTLPLLFNFGAVVGPLIGGSSLFTHPNPHSPYEDRKDEVDLALNSLSGAYVRFRSNHPYALSNIVVCLFLWFSLVMGFLFLEETNDDFRNRRDYGLDLGDRLVRFFGNKPPTRPWNKTSTKSITEATPLLLEGETIAESDCAVSAHGSVKASSKSNSEEDIDDVIDENVGTEEDELDSEAEEVDSDASLDSIAPFLSRSMSNAVVRRYSLTSELPKGVPHPLTARVITVILSNCIISLHSIAYNEFLPVFLAARFKPELLKFPLHIEGGFGLDSNYIGNLFSSTGIMGMMIVLVIFPWIDRRFGTLQGFRFSLSIFPFVYAAVPMAIFTLHKYNDAFPNWVTPVFLYTLTSLKSLASATGMPQVTLLNHRAAAKEHRAYVNSLTMSMLALARCIGPIVFGYLMSFGDSHDKGWIAWWLMAIMAIFGLLQLFAMRDYED